MRKLNAQQTQAIHNRREQINAAVSGCIKLCLDNLTPEKMTSMDMPTCPLPDVSKARWRAMLIHVWNNSDIYSPPRLAS